MTKPIRIALIMKGDRAWVGGMEYIRNIILALASLPQDVRITFEISLLANKSTDQKFIKFVQPYLSSVIIVDEQILPTFLNRVKWALTRQLLKRPDYRYDAILEYNKFDFVYPCNYSDCGFNLKYVTAWFPDFQHKYLTEFFSKEEVQSRDNDFLRIVQRSPSVILSSKSAEIDFNKFFPNYAHKSNVLSFRTIPHSQWYEGDSQEIQLKYCLPDKFFIISNQFWQHKNHFTVFRAMKLLQERGVNPVVVCTGNIYDYRQPDFSDEILQSIHKLGLARQVHLLGLLPKIEQIQLLRRSIALIQPSLFEGWSSVVEDARCMGKPMILSDFPVHLEQNPPNSRFFERMSPTSLASVMADYWQTFLPGPDRELESTAREKNKKEVQAFAYDFLNIAKHRKK